MNVQSLKTKKFSWLLFAALLFAGMLVGALLVTNGGGSGEARAQNSGGPSSNVSEDEPVARAASIVGPSAVQIDVLGNGSNGSEGDGQGVGSGVVYREDGYIVTNNHVVEGAGEVEVVFADGSREPAEVVGGDELTDLAVLQVDRNDLPAATFADSGG